MPGVRESTMEIRVADGGGLARWEEHALIFAQKERKKYLTSAEQVIESALFRSG